jgi:hypothetical protein
LSHSLRAATKSLRLSIACRQVLAIPRTQNIAGGRLMVEMQLDCADTELTDYLFDALVDGGVVGAVASDKFFDNRAYRSG